MDKSLRSLLALLAILLLVLSPVVDSAADDELFPLNPGNSWTYRDMEGNLETLTVNRTLEARGVPLIEASYDRNRPFYYILSNEGVYRLQPDPGSSREKPRGTINLLLQWPLEPGKTWQSPWSDPPLSFTVLDRGPLKVAAGYFRDSVKIGYRPVSSPLYQGYIWFEPGVGLLAQEENAHRSELISYSFTELLAPAAYEITGDRLARLFRSPAAEKKDRPAASLSRLKGLLLSGPFYLFVLLILLGTISLAAYLRSGRVELDFKDSPDIQEGEITLASAMVREGLYEDAMGILQRLTARHPQWPDIAALLGRAYRETGRHHEACIELKRALTLNPEMAKARLELVRTYLSLHESAMALEEVEAVLTHNQGFADAIYLKGEILASMGMKEEALEYFRKALGINPSFAEAQAALEGVLAEEGD